MAPVLSQLGVPPLEVLNLAILVLDGVESLLVTGRCLGSIGWCMILGFL